METLDEMPVDRDNPFFMHRRLVMSQTWITDKDFHKSASNLDTKRLGSQIYEGIHILASLLNVNDRLVNPKRNVRNYPAAKLWVGYETELLCYIGIHLDYWLCHLKYKSEINYKNWHYLYLMIWSDFNYMTLDIAQKYLDNVTWITDELIQTHRSVLIQKEDKKRFALKAKREMIVSAYDRNMYSQKKYYEEIVKVNEQIENNYYYCKLWPNCPDDLEMRYDWRD